MTLQAGLSRARQAMAKDTPKPLRWPQRKTQQKADVIWFLYREDYYQRSEPGYRPQHDVELILGKGRDLRVGEPVILREDFAHMRLTDWDGDKPDRRHAQLKSNTGLS